MNSALTQTIVDLSYYLLARMFCSFAEGVRCDRHSRNRVIITALGFVGAGPATAEVTKIDGALSAALSRMLERGDPIHLGEISQGAKSCHWRGVSSRLRKYKL